MTRVKIEQIFDFPAPPQIPTPPAWEYWAPPTLTATQTVFTLPVAPQMVLAFRNGLAMKPGLDYTWYATEITFVAGQIPQAGDEMMFYFVPEGER